MNERDETYPEICAALSQVRFSEHHEVVGNDFHLGTLLTPSKGNFNSYWK